MEWFLKTWIKANADDAPIINFKPIGDIAYLPDIEFVENEFMLRFANVANVTSSDSERVIKAIIAATNTCKDVRRYMEEDKG